MEQSMHLLDKAFVPRDVHPTPLSSVRCICLCFTPTSFSLRNCLRFHLVYARGEPCVSNSWHSLTYSVTTAPSFWERTCTVSIFPIQSSSPS
jgi:hypothetical protein